MSKPPDLFYAGGDVLRDYGAPSLRTSRTEDVAEQFSRASTASYIAKDGSTLWASSGVLRTEWVSGEPTLKLSTADNLYWDINFPPQPMSVYVKFDRLTAMNTGDGVVALGSSGPGRTPRFLLYSNGTNFTALYHDGVTQVTVSATAAPVANDNIELVAVLSTAGSLTLHQSINSATATTATASSTALTYPSTWYEWKLSYNSLMDSGPGQTRLYALKVHTGARSLDYMRALS